jgi:ribonuclease P protein component
LKFSFSFSHRLHRSDEFERVLKSSGLINKWFSLHSKANNAGLDRLGIVVSKRIVAKSTARNRIKRIIREFFRQMPAENLSSLDIVIKVRKNPSNEKTAVLGESLFHLLTKVRTTPK